MATALSNGATRRSAAPRDQSVAAMADRVEALLAGFGSVSSPRVAKEQAEELVRTIVGFYGAGLERVLTIVHDALDGRSELVFERLCDDKLVETLLCLHGLHPVPLDERVQNALDSVRPYLKSHEGGVEIVDVTGGVVTLRLEGNCKGCPSSTATVKLAVERAILERVPEIREVRAETAAPARKPLYNECVIVLDDILREA
jgi:Fe-S cluster biogenesis protein NfuA